MSVSSGTKKLAEEKKALIKNQLVCFAIQFFTHTGLNFLAAFMAKTFALSA